MASLITATQILSQTDNTDRTTSYTSNSISPTAGKLLICAINYVPLTNNAYPTTLSGVGATWTLLQTQVFNNRGTQLWWGKATTTGALTISGFSGTFDSLTFSVTQFNNTDPANPIVQSAKAFSSGAGTSSTVTLNPFEKSLNGTFGSLTRKDSDPTSGSGFTALYDGIQDNAWFNTEWKDTNDTSVDWTHASHAGGESDMVACEIRQYESSFLIMF